VFAGKARRSAERDLVRKNLRTGGAYPHRRAVRQLEQNAVALIGFPKHCTSQRPPLLASAM
jgi:hypothetical protein